MPWMPTYGAEMPIQRVPSGLPGPGGIGSASGGPVGRRRVPPRVALHVDDLEGAERRRVRATRPVATPNVRTSFAFRRSRRSLFEPRMITIGRAEAVLADLRLDGVELEPIGSRMLVFSATRIARER